MIKDRPITPLLVKQMKVQSERLKQCGLSAKEILNAETTINGYQTVQSLYGTIYSKSYRYNRVAPRESYQELLQRINRQSNGMF